MNPYSQKNGSVFNFIFFVTFNLFLTFRIISDAKKQGETYVLEKG